MSAQTRAEALFLSFLRIWLTNHIYYIDIQFCAVNPSLLAVLLRVIDGWRLRIVTRNLKEPSTVAARVFLFGGF